METILQIFDYIFLILCTVGFICFLKKKTKEYKILISMATVVLLIESLINNQWVTSMWLTLLILIGIILYFVGHRNHFDA